MLKTFEEWVGRYGRIGSNKGFETREEAENIKCFVYEEWQDSLYVRDLDIEVIDRYNNGRWWMHVTGHYVTFDCP